MTRECINRMKDIDIRTVDKSELVDIKNIHIDPYDIPENKMRDYIKQIKNPYCFLCDGYAVKIEFADSERTIEDCFMEFVEAMV